jgi:hypothetical protein
MHSLSSVTPFSTGARFAPARPQPLEESARIGTQGAGAVAAFLHDQRGRIESTDERAVGAEIRRPQHPDAGRIDLRRILPQGQNQVIPG